MTDKFSLPSWSARNPLGIIALFISLIYGMSALLLGTSVKNLAETNQTILVAFIAGFPFIVLSVFGWLVAKHHRKLYGPGDYRSDEGFLNAASAAPPQALGQRLREEIELALEDKPSKPTDARKDKAKEAPSSQSISDHEAVNLKPSGDSDSVLRAYAAENLVFQDLQNEFGGALKRHVSIGLSNRQYQLDGLLETKEKTIFVEVKQLFARTSISILIQRSKLQFRDLAEYYPGSNAIFVLAIVTNFAITDDNRTRIEAEVTEAQSMLGGRFEIRIYSFAELSKKYGLWQKPTTRLGNV